MAQPLLSSNFLSNINTSSTSNASESSSSSSAIICDELICGSIISKCLLMKSCQCNFKDYYCYKNCLNCLGDLSKKCCNCLNMCPSTSLIQNNNNNLSSLNLIPNSNYGDFYGIPQLFLTLTLDPYDDRWTVFTYSINITDNVNTTNKLLKSDNNLLSSESLEILTTPSSSTTTLPSLNSNNNNNRKRNYNERINNNKNLQDLSTDDTDNHQQQLNNNDKVLSSSIVNCTVIYLNNCISMKKCIEYCESMGSNGYRWFHDGCCECIGSKCINYGINENRCIKCPESKQNNKNKDKLKDNIEEYEENEEYDTENEDYPTINENPSDNWDYGEGDLDYF